MTMENGTALALSRVTAHFPDGETALKEMTFSVRHGSFVSLIGPSGAGKSTLIRIMLGLMPVKSGDIVRNYVRPAVVFQNYALFPWLTALENVEFGLKMARAGKKERQRIAREKLREVGLEHLENHYPSALSGGQSQRVGLARAL
ncbi:MAG TPA: ATP-binding cassette domain-containing protein, partial [Candidatus Paceibacterota bacterium]|nr:ATP-binding cassette domain-containing protein [Candidatus Paceibacterota bacterium]